MNDERINRLEEKIAYLERHVTEQDKAMLELNDELTRLRREVNTWRAQQTRNASSSAGGEEPADERPPHY